MDKVEFPAIKLVQNELELIVFCCPCETIYEYFDVSRRIDDKIQGYQRSFSNSRIKQIKNYLSNENGIIPNSILVNLEDGAYEFNKDLNILKLELEKKSLGLIIDGQHRVKGCYDANPEFCIVVVAVLATSQ